MEVVDLFLNFRFYIRLQRFIYDYRVLKGSLEVEGAGGSVTNLLARVPNSDETDPPSRRLESLLILSATQILHNDNAV